MNISSIKQQFKKYFDQVRTGNIPGISWGYDLLDEYAGKIEPGQVNVVGAYSGVGKSYFAANIMDNLFLGAPDTKILVISSELDAFDYIKRHVYMRAGIWDLQHKNHPREYSQRVEKETLEFMTFLDTKGNIDIKAPIFKWEEAKQAIIDQMPDIVFIDFIQQFSFGEAIEPKDAMPKISLDIQEMSKGLGISFLILAQVSNYTTYENRATNLKAPVDFGKELVRAAHRSFTLIREKKDGALDDTLKLFIDKSRGGRTGYIEFIIHPGYRLEQKR